VIAPRACRFDRACVADDRIGAVEHGGFGVLGLAPRQGLPLRAAVRIALGIVGDPRLGRQRLAFTHTVFVQKSVRKIHNEWRDESWQGIISEIPIVGS
jgi:hypothetical protein